MEAVTLRMKHADPQQRLFKLAFHWNGHASLTWKCNIIISPYNVFTSPISLVWHEYLVKNFDE